MNTNGPDELPGRKPNVPGHQPDLDNPLINPVGDSADPDFVIPETNLAGENLTVTPEMQGVQQRLDLFAATRFLEAADSLFSGAASFLAPIPTPPWFHAQTKDEPSEDGGLSNKEQAISLLERMQTLYRTFDELAPEVQPLVDQEDAEAVSLIVQADLRPALLEFRELLKEIREFNSQVYKEACALFSQRLDSQIERIPEQHRADFKAQLLGRFLPDDEEPLDMTYRALTTLLSTSGLEVEHASESINESLAQFRKIWGCKVEYNPNHPSTTLPQIQLDRALTLLITGLKDVSNDIRGKLWKEAQEGNAFFDALAHEDFEESAATQALQSVRTPSDTRISLTDDGKLRVLLRKQPGTEQKWNEAAAQLDAELALIGQLLEQEGGTFSFNCSDPEYVSVVLELPLAKASTPVSEASWALHLKEVEEFCELIRQSREHIDVPLTRTIPGSDRRYTIDVPYPALEIPECRRDLLEIVERADDFLLRGHLPHLDRLNVFWRPPADETENSGPDIGMLIDPSEDAGEIAATSQTGFAMLVLAQKSDSDQPASSKKASFESMLQEALPWNPLPAISENTQNRALELVKDPQIAFDFQAFFNPEIGNLVADIGKRIRVAGLPLDLSISRSLNLSNPEETRRTMLASLVGLLDTLPAEFVSQDNSLVVGICGLAYGYFESKTTIFANVHTAEGECLARAKYNPGSGAFEYALSNTELRQEFYGAVQEAVDRVPPESKYRAMSLSQALLAGSPVVRLPGYVIERCVGDDSERCVEQSISKIDIQNELDSTLSNPLFTIEKQPDGSIAFRSMQDHDWTEAQKYSPF